MLTCDMTFDGPPCGAPAWYGLGILYPGSTVHLTGVAFACDTCVRRIPASGSRLRVYDLETARKLKAKMDGVKE